MSVHASGWGQPRKGCKARLKSLTGASRQGQGLYRAVLGQRIKEDDYWIFLKVSTGNIKIISNDVFYRFYIV